MRDIAKVTRSAMRTRDPSQKRAGPESRFGRPTGVVAWGAVGASHVAPREGSPRKTKARPRPSPGNPNGEADVGPGGVGGWDGRSGCVSLATCPASHAHTPGRSIAKNHGISGM